MKRYLKKILIWANLIVGGALLLSYLANYINPAHFWLIAFFGLAYPVIFIFNFCFFVFWIWRRKWYALISLVIVLVGWNNVGRYFQFHLFRPAFKHQTQMKLLSFNVRLFNYYHWEKVENVSDSILSYINRQDPDIVCIQEFLVRNNRKKASMQYINNKLFGFSYRYFFSTEHKSSLQYGIATYSKYPIIREGSVPFPHSYNACIYTDVIFDHDTIRVYNVHLQSIKLVKHNYNFLDSLVFDFNKTRMNQVRDISERLKTAFIRRSDQVNRVKEHLRKSPYPVILCGDFNDTPVSYTYQQLRGDMRDAFRNSGIGIGNTYRGNFPSYRIDYIFYSKELVSGKYHSDRVKLSDHYPIECSIALKNGS